MRAKVVLLITVLVLLWEVSPAQTGEWMWFQDAGGVEYDGVSSIESDISGSLYVTGYYESPATFGSFMVPEHGYDDSYIAKLSSSGEWQWVKDIGGVLFDRGTVIKVDNEGDVYAMGSVSATVSFGPYSIACPQGYLALYIAKLNSSGDWQWVRQILVSTQTSSANIHNAVVLDDGSICVSGGLSGTVNFGTHSITSYGNGDVYIAKIDADGNWLWVNHFGGSGNDYCCGLASDSTDNIYIAGLFVGLSDFGTTELTSVGYNDIFIAKCNADGTFGWAIQCGGSDEFEWLGNALAISQNDEIFFTGGFEGTATFGEYQLTSNGGMDIVIGKINLDGNWIWVVNSGGSGSDTGRCITTDQQGYIYVSGDFQNVVSFGAEELTCISNTDIYLAQLDNSGNYIWATQASPMNWSAPNCMTVDTQANVYIGGDYNSEFTLGNINMPDPGEMNLFVAKFGIAVPVQDEVTPSPIGNVFAYPNPFSDQLQMAYETKNTPIYSAGIYNIRGQLVYKPEIDQSSRNFHAVWDGCDINGTRCAEGIYILKLMMEDNTVKFKKITLFK
jgi:hypothetical protein